MGMSASEKVRTCKIFRAETGSIEGGITARTEKTISEYLNEHPNYKIISVTPIGHNGSNILIIFEIN